MMAVQVSYSFGGGATTCKDVAAASLAGIPRAEKLPSRLGVTLVASRSRSLPICTACRRRPLVPLHGFRHAHPSRPPRLLGKAERPEPAAGKNVKCPKCLTAVPVPRAGHRVRGSRDGA